MSGNLTAYYEGVGTRSESFVLTLDLPTFVFAGDGNDYISGAGGNDLLAGGLGTDIIEGGDGNDTIYGDNSADPLQAGSTDNILGGTGRDTIFGGGGNDFINGEHDNDWIDGGPGNDIIWGGPGSDVIYGGDGNDVIYAFSAAQAPANLLSIATSFNGLNDSALAGNHQGSAGYIDAGGDFFGDKLFGGDGNDTLVGSNGIDTFTGGKGKDHFVFNVLPSTNTDVIKDFSVKDDTIDLLKAKFAGVGGPGVLAKGKFHVGSHAGDTSDRIIYDKSHGKLYYDSDGTGGNPKILFAKLDAGLHMTHDDFLII
jgi:serralysin